VATAEGWTVRVLHCTETPGLHGAQDTLNCAVAGGGVWLLVALAVMLILLGIIAAIIVRREHEAQDHH